MSRLARFVPGERPTHSLLRPHAPIHPLPEAKMRTHIGAWIALALLLLAGVVLAGCEADRQRLSTAPVTPPAAGEAAAASTVEAPVSELLAGPTTLGGPLKGLNAAELARFAAGQDEFADVEEVEDGLGPVFNEASCVSCHDAPVGGTTGRGETRFGRVEAGRFDPLAHLGGSLLQDHAIGTVGGGVGTFT